MGRGMPTRSSDRAIDRRAAADHERTTPPEYGARRGPLLFRRQAEQPLDGDADVGLAHQGLADEDRRDAGGLEPLGVGAGITIGGMTLSQLMSGLAAVSKAGGFPRAA